MTMYELSDKDLATLSGKTVVVTGGATGIGRATVRLLHGLRILIPPSAEPC